MIPEQTHKRCTSCCEWLPFEDFPAHKRMHNGLSSHCRKCHREATQDWRRRNRDEINRARREAYGSTKPHNYPANRASSCGSPKNLRGAATSVEAVVDQRLQAR